MFGKFLFIAKEKKRILKESDSKSYVIVNKNESVKILALYQAIETKALKSNRAESKCLVHFCP